MDNDTARWTELLNKRMDQIEALEAKLKERESEIERLKGLDHMFYESYDRIEALCAELARSIEKWIPSMKSIVRVLKEEGFNRPFIEPKEKMIQEFEAHLKSYNEKMGAK